MHHPSPNDSPHGHIPPQGSVPPWGYGSPPAPPPRVPALVWIFIGVGVLFFFGLVITFAVGIALGARAEGRATRRSDPAAETSPAPDLPAARRDVPEHDGSLLAGCSPTDLDLIEHGIGSAIEVGAPTYNRGDFQGCFSKYEMTARNIEAALPASCRGPAAALAEGRSKAAKMSQASDRAWAMRDAFDGLLDVIDRAR